MEWDCHQNLSRLFYYLDEGRDADLATLFAADGVSHRQGKALKGRDEILAVIRERPQTQITRHVMGNVFVTATGPNAAEAVSYVTVYAYGSRSTVSGSVRFPSDAGAGAAALFRRPAGVVVSRRPWSRAL